MRFNLKASLLQMVALPREPGLIWRDQSLQGAAIDRQLHEGQRSNGRFIASQRSYRQTRRIIAHQRHAAAAASPRRFTVAAPTNVRSDRSWRNRTRFQSPNLILAEETLQLFFMISLQIHLPRWQLCTPKLTAARKPGHILRSVRLHGDNGVFCSSQGRF